MVGEVYLLSTKRVADLLRRRQRRAPPVVQLPAAPRALEAAAWRKRIDRVVEELDPRDAWPSWVISNHDQPRHRTRYGTEARARAAAVLLLTLRGTPFLYAGEELGLEDAVIPPSRVLDPGGRDGCRAPIPWTPAPDHGWSTDDPWLPGRPTPTSATPRPRRPTSGQCSRSTGACSPNDARRPPSRSARFSWLARRPRRRPRLRADEHGWRRPSRRPRQLLVEGAAGRRRRRRPRGGTHQRWRTVRRGDPRPRPGGRPPLALTVMAAESLRFGSPHVESLSVGIRRSSSPRAADRGGNAPPAT